MPAVTRLGDLSVGIDAAPTVTISASSNVFVNTRGAHRVGDAWVPHGVPPHGRSSVTGSPNVYVNNQKLVRVGDNISCGDKSGQGSPNVFCNG